MLPHAYLFTDSSDIETENIDVFVWSVRSIQATVCRESRGTRGLVTKQVTNIVVRSDGDATRSGTVFRAYLVTDSSDIQTEKIDVFVWSMRSIKMTVR